MFVYILNMEESSKTTINYNKIKFEAEQSVNSLGEESRYSGVGGRSIKGYFHF